ncbi:MAG: glycosyltransferase [Acidobacteria bacterium]|nr:glycosyltransferase [Acidobacteriota bacterium]
MRNVSVTILAKNSSKHLKKCLDALKRFDDIVLLDNGSTDDTLIIAKAYPNVRIFHSEFIGFGPLKDLAASHASNDWVFSVDSDEVVTPELASSVLEHTLESHQVGVVHRLNHFHGRLVNGAGWQNDLSHRLYDRTVTGWGSNRVHESLGETAGGTVLLHGKLLHYPFESVEDLSKKGEQYSTLYAEQNRHVKRSSRFTAAMAAIIGFGRNYFLKKGILWGSDGFQISRSNAIGSYQKYLKLAEANRHLTTSLIISTYNSADVLKVVLSSVLAQSEMPNEVIVADDGSTDRTKEVVTEFAKASPVPVIHRWQENSGFRSSRLKNLGISAAAGEYLILLDGDMLIHPDFVRDHKRWALRGQFLQGSRVWLREHDVDAIVAKGEKKLPGLSKVGNPLNSIRSPLLARIFSTRVGGLKGTKSCNLSFFRNDCYGINGFDENFEGWGREDTDFAVRLMNSGIKRRNLRFAGVAYHLSHPVRSRDRLSQNEELLQRSIEEKATFRENGLIKDQAASR